MAEITRPQDIFARQNMRIIFEKLAHTSVMRLDSVSMEKLYDLMTMAVKYQVTFCSKPKDLLLVTYNHLDSMAKFVSDSAVNTKALLENAYKTVDTVELNFANSVVSKLYSFETDVFECYRCSEA